MFDCLFATLSRKDDAIFINVSLSLYLPITSNDISCRLQIYRFSISIEFRITVKGCLIQLPIISDEVLY